MTDTTEVELAVSPVIAEPIVEMAGPPQAASVLLQTTFTSGPLPPADEFARYESACPGSAKWIMDQAALHADRAHEIATRSLDQQASMLSHNREALRREDGHNIRNQICAFSLALFGLILAGFCISKGETGAGLAVFIVQIVSMVGLFLGSRGPKAGT